VITPRFWFGMVGDLFRSTPTDGHPLIREQAGFNCDCFSSALGTRLTTISLGCHFSNLQTSLQKEKKWLQEK